VTLDDWILSLHVLSAFALAGTIVFFWALYGAALVGVDPASAALMRLGKLGSAIVGVGFGGTLVFGVWLAISLDAYHLWDGWVIAGLVLWAIGGALGGRTGKLAEQPGRMRESMLFHAATSLIVVLILVDMIWKPGA
jgi:hypothetical protein